MSILQALPSEILWPPALQHMLRCCAAQALTPNHCIAMTVVSRIIGSHIRQHHPLSRAIQSRHNFGTSHQVSAFHCWPAACFLSIKASQEAMQLRQRSVRFQTDSHRGWLRRRSDTNASQEASAAAAVFQALAHAALQDAAAGAQDDEAEGEAADDAGAGAMAEREEWYVRAAAVGRAAAGPIASFLAQQIAEKQQTLQHCARTGAPSVLLIPLFC